MDPLGFQAAIDALKEKIEDPAQKTLLDAIPAAVTAIRAERLLLQEFLTDSLNRVEAMLKPFNEFIASVSIKAGK